MKSFHKVLLCISTMFLVSAFSPATASKAATQAVPIIIDTDMAIDDWPAILYLLNEPRARVIAITATGAGEAHCGPGVRNAMKLLRLSGSAKKTIPVACGDEEPSDGYHVFPKAWRKGADTLYGVSLPDHPAKPSPKHAVDLLSAILSKARQPVRIVALGPLTNIAQVLDRNTSIKRKIERLYIMGGAIDVPGNILVKNFTDHLKNKVAEWNIYIDPLAARKVFRSGVPIALVPLDATNKVQVTEIFTNRFKTAKRSAEAEFIDKIFDKNKWFVDSGEYYFWDPLAAVVAMDRNICQFQAISVDVRVPHTQDAPLEYPDNPTYSTKRKDGKPRRSFGHFRAGQTYVAADTGGKMEVCFQPDAERFKKKFIRVINLP